MLTLNDIIIKLEENLPYLRHKYGIKNIGIFGSFVRDEQTSDSDIDILVEYNDIPDYHHIYLNIELEEILNREVDLATPDSLRKYTKESVLREVKYV